MRLLFDQNLSHRLPRLLGDIFPEADHVRALGLDRASDEEIWDFAKVRGFCLVTQDSDFAERVRLYGAPPKVVWLTCGNASTERVAFILRSNADAIVTLFEEADLHLAELS